MAATKPVIMLARTARFLAVLICISPASAWAATYQAQYLAFYAELLPKPLEVPLAEWLTGGIAVALAVAALLVLRSKSLHHRGLLGGLLALAAGTALVGASGLHLASEANAKATPKFFSHNIVPLICIHNTTFSPDDCFNGINLPASLDPDPAVDPDVIILANPYEQPVRILQLALQQPGDPALGESVHLAPTGQGCFENETLPPALPETSCIKVLTGGDETCYTSSVVLQPGATCDVVLADDVLP